MKTESETGERDTPHSPRALRENINQATASAWHLVKPILGKVRLFCSLRGLLTKYSDFYEILSQARFNGMEQWNAERFMNCSQSPTYRG